MAVDAFGNIVPDTVPGTGPLPPLLAGATGGESKIDPSLRPYLERGLQRAEQLFFGIQPSMFPGQMYVGPSAQTEAALAQQEALATQPSPVLSAAQSAFLSGLGAQSSALPLYQNIYGAAGARPGFGVYERAAAGQLAPSTGLFEQLFGAARPGAPSIYGEVSRGFGIPSTVGLSALASAAQPGAPTALTRAAEGGMGVSAAPIQALAQQAQAGVPSALTRAAEGAGAIGTSFLSGLTQQAGMQPAAGLYGQVAGGGFQNLALPGTAQTAAGSFLMGNPYQQAMIEAATRPLVQQFGETVIPGISSQFSRAGRYGSGAMERAQSRATEAFGRSLGDITAGIVGQEYGRERGFQEAARQQLAGLSQQDLANRLGAAGALEASLRGGIAQQAGLFGQQAGLEQQNLATQLQAAQAAEATRQSQLAQAAGLQGQVSAIESQNIARQLEASGATEAARQAQLAQAAGLQGQLLSAEQQALQTRLGAAGAEEAARQAQIAQQAGLAGQLAGLQQQGVATQLAGAGGLEQAQQAALGTQLQAAGGLGATQAQDIQRQLAAAGMAPSFFQMGFLPSQQLAQIGAQREAIAAQPLQEQLQRYQFQQQLPYSQLQSYLSSVYGTPLASSVYPQQQQYQNRTMNTLAGAGLGYAGGQALGSFLGGTPFNLTSTANMGYGLAGGALGGLLGGGFF